MGTRLFPAEIPNWIDGRQRPAISCEWFDKLNPADGRVACRVTRSLAEDVHQAVKAAKRAQPSWADTPPVQRGMLLHKIVLGMEARQREIAQIVALETGKSYKDAYAETGGAIALGLFYAGEGQRLYGRTTTSGIPDRSAMTIRQPIGIAGLIVPANTPIANVAWKIFPALICGNAVVLKAAEDTPATAWIVGHIAQEAGLPAALLNIIQGYGEEAGAPLVEHPDVGVISFTGSTAVGRSIQRVAGERLAKVSLELGGKNPFVVCDDADLENAARWALLSAFSNAGQRCASGSRIIVFDAVYDRFRDMVVTGAKQLKVGPTDDDDLGPVINEKQLTRMLDAIEGARQKGAAVLAGGHRLTDLPHRNGFYMTPTIIENVGAHDDISSTELFGPIACLYRVKDFAEALALANDSLYGLTACIHTRNLHRAIQFTQKVQAGVAIVNAGTYGSEPHMPFGGLKQSGNGSREPGTEALDVYSELKDIYISTDPTKL
ncbi:MAG: aldehyde dehydrogenase family protein [bacterium]|uniref:Aldehyde dehydrogenase family protein n=1 Tax=Candidatus Methylomirabilis tolerans TaxID=3123416 RepID=A0AAJ1EIF8_9BACT|nr:aldehyde dehydrogenase family protein [Candidatus Methylomirabilis sp.]